MKVSCVLRVVCVIVATAFTCFGDDPKVDRANMQIFMRQKLDVAKAITEGVVLEKFDMISINTAAMRRMTKTNFWIQTGNTNYLAKMTNFQADLDKLFFAAGDRNLDQATAAYGKILKSCVDCHHIVRKEQLGLPRWGSQEE